MQIYNTDVEIIFPENTQYDTSRYEKIQLSLKSYDPSGKGPVFDQYSAKFFNDLNNTMSKKYESPEELWDKIDVVITEYQKTKGNKTLKQPMI